MLKFEDGNNWFNERINGVRRAYIIPKGVGGIAVDIGANVGAFSYVNHKVFDKIISIEPAKETYDKCVKNTSDFENVSVYRYAVSNKSGEIIKLFPFINGNVSGNATTLKGDITAKHYDFDTYEEVETISLEDIYKTFNIDKINYLKIDCEGGEYGFLINCDLSNIDYIAIEIHLHLGDDKMKELRRLIEKTHNEINSIGNGIKTHFEITYKNKKL